MLRRKRCWLQLNVGKVDRVVDVEKKKGPQGKSLGKSRVGLVMNGGLHLGR